MSVIYDSQRVSGNAVFDDQVYVAGGAPHLISVADSQQVNTAAPVAIKQTHRIGIANSQQTNTASAAGIVQSGVHYVGAANSHQINQAAPVAIRQTHRIGIANSQQVNRCSSIRVSDGSVQAPILTSHPHYIIKAPARRFIISK